MKSYEVHGNYACFWKGPLSQWHKCRIVDGDLEFNCAEQAMMYRKAELFKDKDCMEAIMSTNSPAEQKKLGRKVANFDSRVWNSVARNVVIHNNLLKFTQHGYLREILVNSGDLTFVECSPYDRIWGIGRGLDYPHLDDSSCWQGKNWLGECITKVKYHILFGVEFDIICQTIWSQQKPCPLEIQSAFAQGIPFDKYTGFPE